MDVLQHFGFYKDFEDRELIFIMIYDVDKWFNAPFVKLCPLSLSILYYYLY